MKKLFSLTLALLLILSMTATAFADDEVIEEPGQGGQPTEWNGTYTPTTSTQFTEIIKTYNSDGNVVVNETLTFTSEYSKSNPDVIVDSEGNVTNTPANLTVADLTVNSLTKNETTGKYEAGKLTVTIPALSAAGIYEWTIKETEGNTAGVGYSSAEIHVTALVEYDNSSHALKLASTTSYIKSENNKKADTFENTFNSGSFTVAKDVEGNMASESETFDIIVTLTSTKPIGTDISAAGTTVTPTDWTTNYTDDTKTTVKDYTYEKKLTISENSGKRTFSNIPVGVTVTVVEDGVGTDNKVKGYDYKGVFTRTSTTDGDGQTTTTDEEFTSLTIAHDTNSDIVVKNENKTEVATGISLDTVPYFLMLAVACVGMFLVLSKKRAYREN